MKKKRRHGRRGAHYNKAPSKRPREIEHRARRGGKTAEMERTLRVSVPTTRS